jgi:1-acyl-sn-glycerol-3-phosphate acyltransferase
VPEARVIPLHTDDLGARPKALEDVGRTSGDGTPRPGTSPGASAAADAPSDPPNAADDAQAPEWEVALADLLAFGRRRILGDYQVDEFGFDPDLTENVFIPLLRPLYQHWFRVETVGMHNVPDTGGALVVANHSGTVPLDSLMTAISLYDDHPAKRHLRMLGADILFRTPVLGSLARKSGNTLACNEDAERLLSSGELVGVWTPIIPAAIVGAEEIYPKIGDLKPLARLLGLPYFPITPTFPLLGPLGAIPLPSKWYIEFGEPIRTDEIEGDADDPLLVFNLTDQVRETIQQTLYRLLGQRRNAFLG